MGCANFLNASAASSGVRTTSAGGTGIPASERIWRAWYSWIFMMTQSLMRPHRNANALSAQPPPQHGIITTPRDGRGIMPRADRRRAHGIAVELIRREEAAGDHGAPAAGG